MSIINITNIIIAAISYLLGSISGSIIISKNFFNEDIREKGSGNAGTTNIFRAYGLKYAFFAMLIDLLKGIFAPIIAYMIMKYSNTFLYGQYIAGVFVVIGHVWPLYYGFKGGKGMATSIGVNIYFNIILVLIQVFELIFVNYIVKIMSMTSILMTITAIIYTLIFSNDVALSIMMIINGIIIIYSHRANIRRLIEGKENKIERLRKK